MERKNELKLDLDQREFPSTAQKSVRHAAVFLVPFKEVIPFTYAGEETALRLGERSLNSFMTNLYLDMYQNPVAYLIPAGEYDEFIQGRDPEMLEGGEKTRESRLRSQFQRAIQFPQKLLYEIGLNGTQESRTTTLSRSVLDDMINKHNLRILRDERMKHAEALSNMGIEVTIVSDKITVSEGKHTGMLLALSTLCKADAEKWALTSFLRCDFRGLNKYRPSFEDAASFLRGEHKKNAVVMDEYMRSLGCRAMVEPLKNTTLGSRWKLVYKRKSKSVYGFHADTDSVETYAYFNKPENISRIGYLLKERSETLYNWFDEKIPTRNCARRYNRKIDIGGKEKRICGFSNRLVLSNPSGTDHQNMKKVIEIYQNTRARDFDR